MPWTMTRSNELSRNLPPYPPHLAAKEVTMYFRTDVACTINGRQCRAGTFVLITGTLAEVWAEGNELLAKHPTVYPTKDRPPVTPDVTRTLAACLWAAVAGVWTAVVLVVIERLLS